MKKQLTLVIGLSLMSTAFTVQAQVRPDEPKDRVLTFNLNIETPSESFVSGSFVTPTTGKKNWEPIDLDHNIAKVTVSRSCYDLDEDDVLVTSFEDVEIGKALDFTDTTIQLGYTYTYDIVCTYHADDVDTDSWGTYDRVYTGVKPALPSYDYTAGENGCAPITFIVTVPTLQENKEPLTVPITKIVLTRSESYYGGDEIAVAENPTTETVELVDETAEEGKSYYYSITAYTAFGTSESARPTIYVGRDYPKAPTAIKYEATGDGVLVTWTAPTGGKNGGIINLDEIRYRVTRITPAEEKLVAEDLAECQYLDPCDDLTEEMSISYRVEAYNEINGSNSEGYDKVIVGPAASMPLYESFNGGSGYYKEPVKPWISGTNGSYHGWEVSTSNWSTGVTGVLGTDEENEGYLTEYMGSYNSEGREDWYNSAKIANNGEANPVLSFYYIPLAAVKMGFKVNVLDNADEATLLKEIDLAEGAEAVWDEDNEEWSQDVYTWTKVNVPLSIAEDLPYFRIQFHATSAENVAENGTIYIDEVLVDNYPGVVAVKAEAGEHQAVLTWDDPSTETQKVTEYAVYVNGEKAASVTEPTYTATVDTTKDNTFAVEAAYNDITAPMSEEVTLTAVSSGVAGIAGETCVEYLNLQGIRVDNPEKGQTVIRRATMGDGSVKITKVVK